MLEFMMANYNLGARLLYCFPRKWSFDETVYTCKPNLTKQRVCLRVPVFDWTQNYQVLPVFGWDSFFRVDFRGKFLRLSLSQLPCWQALSDLSKYQSYEPKKPWRFAKDVPVKHLGVMKKQRKLYRFLNARRDIFSDGSQRSQLWIDVFCGACHRLTVKTPVFLSSACEQQKPHIFHLFQQSPPRFEAGSAVLKAWDQGLNIPNSKRQWTRFFDEAATWSAVPPEPVGGTALQVAASSKNSRLSSAFAASHATSGSALWMWKLKSRSSVAQLDLSKLIAMAVMAELNGKHPQLKVGRDSRGGKEHKYHQMEHRLCKENWIRSEPCTTKVYVVLSIFLG